MDLQQVAMTEFVLLQANWTAEKSIQFIERLNPSHVIVHRSEAQNDYYLLTAEEALDMLAKAHIATSVSEALHLAERSTTPALEGFTDAESAPDQCIVLEDGQLSGFFDVAVPPQQVISVKRGGESFVSNKPELVSRSLVVEAPEKVQVHAVFSLLVSLSASSLPEKGASIPVALPIGTTVDILVQPRRGFELVEGNGEGMLTVSSDDETLPFQFKLQGVDVGPGQIRVMAFHQGQPLGDIKLTVTVTEAPANTTPARRRAQERTLAPVSIHQPDLQMWIQELEVAGKPAFIIRLTAQDSALELNLKPFGPIPLKVNALQYFQEFFEDIENLPLRSSREKAIAEQLLAAKGSHLFESLLPEELRLLLWKFRNRIQSIQVQSEEPWIPWELCKLFGPDENGRIVEGPFLCEGFAIARWLPPTPFKPSLKLMNIAVVIPTDSSLDFAPNERAYLLSLKADHRQASSIPATFLELRAALASGIFDGWHFSGHGSFAGDDPNNSIIYLENHETFTPEDLSGVVSNLGAAKPLVFLNACQIGRSAMSLTGIGGWASKFLRAGAGAFIGSYWSIDDKSALDFAQAFYNRLLAGIPIGRAVQEARLAIKPTGDPSWLAYTVFADPLATVQEGISSSQ